MSNKGTQLVLKSNMQIKSHFQLDANNIPKFCANKEKKKGDYFAIVHFYSDDTSFLSLSLKLFFYFFTKVNKKTITQKNSFLNLKNKK